MKKIGMLVFILMMMAFVTAVQAEVRAGGLPSLVVDDRISDSKAPASAPVRAGGLPSITVDDRINNCDCRMFPSCCPPPVVAPAPISEPVPEPAPVPPSPPVMEKVSIMLNVEFDTNKTVVKEKYRDDIKRVADFMKTYPETNAVIEGHTDNVGKEVVNVKLSQRRADNIKVYLAEKFGIDSSRRSRLIR